MPDEIKETQGFLHLNRTQEFLIHCIAKNKQMSRTVLKIGERKEFLSSRNKFQKETAVILKAVLRFYIVRTELQPCGELVLMRSE